MKKILTVLISLLCVSVSIRSGNPLNQRAPTAFAASRQNEVRWERVVGVISAINVDNPVADIHSGTFPWSAQSGNARINLATGAASFKVEGLVIIGTPFSGTPGPITAVTGTLVCNAGEETEAVLDTPKVPLSANGDAIFSGSIPSIPSLCANPIFLIRIADPEGAAGLWIATGADRSGG